MKADISRRRTGWKERILKIHKTCWISLDWCEVFRDRRAIPIVFAKPKDTVIDQIAIGGSGVLPAFRLLKMKGGNNGETELNATSSGSIPYLQHF